MEVEIIKNFKAIADNNDTSFIRKSNVILYLMFAFCCQIGLSFLNTVPIFQAIDYRLH